MPFKSLQQLSGGRRTGSPALALICLLVTGLVGKAAAYPYGWGTPLAPGSDGHPCASDVDCAYSTCNDRPCDSSSLSEHDNPHWNPKLHCNNGTWHYGCAGGNRARWCYYGTRASNQFGYCPPPSDECLFPLTTIATPIHYSYQMTMDLNIEDSPPGLYHDVSGRNVTSVAFTVKASNDAHIALSEVNNHRGKKFEIVIGGWDNGKSVIRSYSSTNSTKTQLTSVSGAPLSSSSHRRFWIAWSWSDNQVRVGRGSTFLSNEFMSADTSSIPYFSINYLLVSTGWGSTGEWKIGCLSCPAGKAVVNYACSECPPGKYSAGGTAMCTQCFAGSYAVAPGASACTLCMNGKASSISGATSESACSECPPGKYSAGGSAMCTQCFAGTYAVAPGASACTFCRNGKASSISGATSESACSECLPGKYSLTSSSLRYFSERVPWMTAQSICRDLGGQLATPENSEEDQVFIDHDAWLGLNDREKEGTWVTSAGALPSYTNWCEGEPNDSGGNEDCGVGSGECWNDLSCDSGHTATYACRFDGSGPTTCSDCVGGYSDKSGASACSWCIAGKASSISGATLESACSDCPSGAYAAEGSTVCTRCTPGTYANSTASSSCVDCPEQAMMCLSIVPEPPTLFDQVLQGRKSCDSSNGMGWSCLHGQCDCFGCKPGQEMINAHVLKCFENNTGIGFAHYTKPFTKAPNVTECKNGATQEHHLCECLPSQGRTECPSGECACYKCSDEDHLELQEDSVLRCMSCPRGEYECTYGHDESRREQCGCYECLNPRHRLEHVTEETFCLSGIDDTKHSAESRQTDCLGEEYTHRVCRNTMDSANKVCASNGSTLIMSNATLFQAIAPGGVLDWVHTFAGSWIGAKEKENDRGSYVFLDGSELPDDHRAWAEPPRGSEPEQPALCVAYWPGHGLFVMDCNFDLAWFGSHQAVCENKHIVGTCECYKCPEEGGQARYLRQRAKPCVQKIPTSTPPPLQSPAPAPQDRCTREAVRRAYEEAYGLSKEESAVCSWKSAGFYQEYSSTYGCRYIAGAEYLCAKSDTK